MHRFIGGVTAERFGTKALLEAGRSVADPKRRDVLAVVPIVRGSLECDIAKLTRGRPVVPEENTAIKTVDSRRRLTENGLCSVDLESRFYAVLSKAGSSGLALNPRRSKSREPERPRAAKVFEKAEIIEMAFLRLVGIK